MSIVTWTCCDKNIYDTPGLIKHLAEAHGITSRRAKVVDSMHLNMDDGSAHNGYAIEIEGVIVCKSVYVPAKKT